MFFGVILGTVSQCQDDDVNIIPAAQNKVFVSLLMGIFTYTVMFRILVAVSALLRQETSQ